MILDIFKGDAFSFSNLVAAINRMPFVPGAAGKLGIFDEEGIYTTTLEVEELNGTLNLIPNTPRGGPARQNVRNQRDLRYFKTLHLPIRDHISADEIQNKRQFGSENEMATAQNEVDQRMMKMLKEHDATVEYGRIGAIKGLILDADGATVLYNLYTQFGINQQTQDYTFGTNTTDYLSVSTTVRGMIQDYLGQDGGDDLEVFCFCGSSFFSRLITNPTVKLAYQYYQSVQQANNPLQQDLRYLGFKYGGITYMQYRGNVSGVPFIASGEAYAFPTNVPGLFKTFYAPGDYMETVNTQGLPRYAKMGQDASGLNKFVLLETQSNPLSLNLRPGATIKLFSSN